MESSGNPLSVTVSCSMRSSLPENAVEETVETPTNAPLQVPVKKKNKSPSKKDEMQEIASPGPLPFSSCLKVESSLTITSPTRRRFSCRTSTASQTDVAPTAVLEARRALRRHRKKVARIVVEQWMFAARHRLLASRLQKLHSERLLRACLEAWRAYGCAKAGAEERLTRRLKRESFREWIAVLHAQQQRKKVEVEAMKKVRGNKVKAAWSGWMRYVRERREKEDEEGVASRFHSRLLLWKALQCWMRYLSSVRRGREQERFARRHRWEHEMRKAFAGLKVGRRRRKVKVAKLEAADDHWRFRQMRRRLREWQDGCGVLIARRKVELEASVQRARWMTSSIFRAWKAYSWRKSREKARQSELLKKFGRLVKGRVWNAWTRVRDVLKLDRMKEELADHVFQMSILKAAFQAWLQFFQQRSSQGEHNEKAEAFRRRRLLQLSLASWKQHRQMKLAWEALQDVGTQHWQKMVERKAIRVWKRWLADRHLKQAERRDASATYKNHLQRWACERILSYGLGEQSSRLQNWLEMQAARAVASLGHVAPYARKWKSRIKKQPSGAGGDRSKAPFAALDLPAEDVRGDSNLAPHLLQPSQGENYGPLLELKPFTRPAPRRPAYL